MATKRPDDTASPSGLELLEARQELPPAPAGNDDEPGGIDEVPSAVHGRVHADLAVRGNDVEPVDDDAPQPRALAHRGVIHDDRVLDDGALVDPHGAAEDRVADGRALDQRRLADVSVVHVAADEARGWSRMRARAHRPVPVVEVEARRLAEESYVRLPVRRQTAHVAPVALLLVRLHAGDLVALEVVAVHATAGDELGDDRAA